jgi:phytoene synthase
LTAPTTQPDTLKDAYGQCREIARKRARNFYYAFVALPAVKRDAICAVYAFMREADDISDDPRQSLDERRKRMGDWFSGWKLVEAGNDTTEPVFLALRDTQKRFAIPGDWLDQLVQGTTLDLDEANFVYQDFEGLYRYCYLVASIVGLVCIRIFGYEASQAEHLAEETGIAFQLTNILRDVAEDAAMGRVYLPEAELSAHGITRQQVLASPGGTPGLKQLLKELADRAERYYGSADLLLPLVHADSRPALWVLVTIYRRLLLRIKSNSYDVFSEKIRVPSYEKLTILALGLTKVLWQKVLPTK